MEEKVKEEEKDWANKWFLHSSLPKWEKELVAKGLEVSIDTAEDMARKGELPISKVAVSCSEGRERRKIIEHFDFAGKSVVEVGCGRGYYTQFLAQEAAKVAALDKMIAGREKHMWNDFRKILEGHGIFHKVVPIEADARDIPLPPDSFDIGTCAGGFFRDLYPIESQSEVLSEMKRVCEKLMIAVYVTHQLNQAQENYLNQLRLRRKALNALGCSEEFQIHQPKPPEKVQQWFRDIGIHHSKILSIDLPCSWAADTSYWIKKIEDTETKERIGNRLKDIEKRIKKHGCKRPPVMLIWA